VNDAGSLSFASLRPWDPAYPGGLWHDGWGSSQGLAPKGHLGGASDPRARPTQVDHVRIVMRDDYRTGEKAAGISSLFSCRVGRTPVWGGHAPPA